MNKKKSSLVLSTLMFIFPALAVQSSIIDSRQQAAPTGTVDKTLSRISGRVLDIDGKPAFQTEVRLAKADDVAANKDAVFVQNRTYAYIDQSGYYQLEWVPAGQYLLIVNADFRFGYAVTYYPDTQDITRAKVLTVGQSENIQNINISLPSPTMWRGVKGLITDAEGHPVQGAQATLFVAKYPWIAPGGSTAEEGVFSVAGFEGVEYLLHAWAEVSPGQYLHSEPLKLEFKAEMEPITVKLTLPGKGLPMPTKDQQ